MNSTDQLQVGQPTGVQVPVEQDCSLLPARTLNVVKVFSIF